MLVIGGCAAGTTPSPSAAIPAPSSLPTPSPVPAPTPTAAPPSIAPTVAPSPTPTPVISTSATFNLLPAEQPAGFVSKIACDGPIGASDPVALVRLREDRDRQRITLRNYADPSSPRTSCTFDLGVQQLIDAHHVVIVDDSGTSAVVDLPEVRFHWFRLPVIADTYSSLIGVSPGLDEVAWRSTGFDGVHRQIHVSDAQGDHLVAELPPYQGGRCGSMDDSKGGAYANGGSRLYVLDQPIPSMNVLMIFEGTTMELSLAPPATGWPDGSAPAMAVWSPLTDTLYYRQHGDVWRWAPGSDPEQFLPGIAWYQPTITPDGRHLAYLAEGGMYLVDLAGDPTPRLVRSEGVQPVFLNSSQLWFLAPAPGGCAASPDQPTVYNIEDSSEAPSIIDTVIAVWPATSSNH